MTAWGGMWATRVRLPLTAAGEGATDGQRINLRSTDMARRTWTGSGTITIYDVNCYGMQSTPAINAFHSIDEGNNSANWSVQSGCNPANYLVFHSTGVDTIGMSYILDSCIRLNTEPNHIDSVFIYTHTDSAVLASDFRTRTPVDTLTYNVAKGCGSYSFGGLLPGTLYYAGVATHDSAGGWSQQINIQRQWTRPKNTLHLSVAETPANGDSGIVYTLSNIAALGANVDTVKVFYSSTGYRTTPEGSPDTAFPRSLFIGDNFSFTMGGYGRFSSSTKYYFTVNCGIKANTDITTRWSLIDTLVNGAALTLGNYASPPLPGLVLTGVDTVKMRFNVTSPFSAGGAFTDSVYIFLGNDSANLANNFRNLTPWSRRDTANCSNIEITGLTNGATYWLGVASKSPGKVWSTRVNILKVITQVGNPVIVRFRRLDNSRVEVKYGGIQQLPSSATTLKMWQRNGWYQTDASIAADTSYTLSLASDTLIDTINYVSGISALFYYSVSPGFTGNWAAISSLNEARIFVDNVKPVNLLSLGVTDSTVNNIVFNIGNGGTISGDVQTLFVYRDTSLTNLKTNFKNSLYAIDSFPKTSLLNHIATGLTEVTRYYIGVSMRDSLGNWADSVVTVSRYTLLKNPLGLYIRESDTSRILKVSFSNLDSLNSRVDTVRLFYNTVKLFDEKSYGSDLKGSYGKITLLANDTVLISNMAGLSKYYFAASDKCFNGITHFGRIGISNIDSITTRDYSEPLNISLAIIDSTFDSLKFTLNNPSSLETDVKYVFIYYSTSDSLLKASYKILTPWRTLTRDGVQTAGTIVVSGLTEATRYYVGIAVQDSAGNWSTNISLDSTRTRIRNPIGLTTVWNPIRNREVRVTLSNLLSLGPKITRLRLFYTLLPQPITDPYKVLVFPAEAESVIVTTGFIGNLVVITLPDSVDLNYHFSVTPGFTEYGKSWYGAINTGNTASIYVDAYEPPNNSIRLLQRDSSLTSMAFEVRNAYDISGMDVETLFVFSAKANSEDDSVALSTQFNTTLTPTASIPLDSAIAGMRIIMTGLDTGTTYFVAVAPRDSNGNYSTNAHVTRGHTASRPLNPLSITGISPYWNTARITINGLNSLSTDIDRKKIRIYHSTTGYVLNPFDTAEANVYDLSGITGNSATVDVAGLTQLQLYYFSISEATTHGYFSPIIDPSNVCQVTTIVASDTVAPNLSALRILADSSRSLRPLTDLYYEVTGLNSITGPDRSKSVLRVFWSSESPYGGFLNPMTGIGYKDTILSKVPGDTLSYIISDLLPGSFSSGKGRSYYLTMSVRDSANNWDLANIKSDIGFTRIDTGRPANDTVWAIDQSSYNRLVVNWRPTWFNNPSATFRDTIVKIGAWVRMDTIRQDTIDRVPPTFEFPIGSSTPQYSNVLTHNSRFHVAFSPINTIGNWGLIEANKSYITIDVPFDSNTISRPPNVCSLWVKRTIAADSVWVGFRVSEVEYNDGVNNIPMNITNVVVYSLKGSFCPDSAGKGTLVPGGMFTVNINKAVDSVKMYLPDSIINGFVSFSAFTVSNLSSDYSNRYSDAFSKAQVSLETYPIPINNLVIDSLYGIGGGNTKPRILAVWHIDQNIGPIPNAVKFLFREYADDVPRCPDASGYSVFTPSAYSGTQRDTVPEDLTFNKRWIVAGFVSGSAGLWSDSSQKAWDTLTTPSSFDTIRPAHLPFIVTATAIDCRTVHLFWSVDTILLRQSRETERDSLKIVLGASKTGSDKYLFPTDANPYSTGGILNYLMASHDTILTGLTPNTDYNFAVSTIDSAGNAAIANAQSVVFARTSVPAVKESTIVFGMDNNTSFFVDWSKAVSNDSISWQPDKNVQYVTVVVNDNGFYTGDIPLQDGPGTGYFMCSTRPVSDKRFTFVQGIDYLNKFLNRETFYVSVFVSAGDHSYPAPVVNLGSLFYKLDNPWVENLKAEQISDTLLLVTFIPRDSTERRIRVSAMYHVNADGTDKPLLKTAVDIGRYGSVMLAMDTLAKDVPCSAYVRLNRLDLAEYNKLKNFDNGVIYIRISLSDMMPLNNTSHEDASFIVMDTIDAKAPSHVVDSIRYDRHNRHIYVSLKDDVVGDLSRVMWGVKNDSLVNDLSYATGNVLTFDSVGFNGLYIRYIDTLGNRVDTLWHDFEGTRVEMDSMYKIVNIYDNGGLKIDVPVGSINNDLKAYAYLHVGLFPRPVNEAVLNSQMFTNVKSSEYYLLLEMPIAYNNGDSLWSKVSGINVGISLEAFDPALRVYRVYNGDKLEYLGGIPDSASSMIWMQGFKPWSYWNSKEHPGGPLALDTFMFVVAKDTSAPVIDTVNSGLVWQGDSAKFVLKVKDNNVYLDVGIKVYTDSLNGLITIWDTVTTSLTSGTRSGVTKDLDKDVTSEFDITSALYAHISNVKSRGLYCAVYVTDGNRRFFQESFPVLLDSMSGRFNSVTESWKIVSITGNLTGSNQDFLPNMVNFQGVYDKTRLRIYRTRNNSFVEYGAGDTSFTLRPGRGFFLITRYNSDDTVSFKTGSITMPAVKSSTGYTLTNGVSDTGWQMLSFPFMGRVSVEDIINSSILTKDTSSRFMLTQRLWKYSSDKRGWSRLGRTDNLGSSQGFGDGFLAYLYPGEKLIVPLLGDAAYIPQKPLVKEALPGKGDWELSVSLSGDDGNGKYKEIDGFNRFGVSTSSFGGMADLLMPGSEFDLGFSEKGGLLNISKKHNDNKGKIWTMVVKSGSALNKDLRLNFADLSLLPTNQTDIP